MGNPKGTAIARKRRVGAAEIGTAPSERCVEARLVHDKARRHDGVFLDLSDGERR